VTIIWTASKGHLDDIPVAELRRFQNELFAYLDVNAPEILRGVRDSGQLSSEAEDGLKTNIAGFKEQFRASLAAAAVGA
jgi:F-type H+-transporting ATPase subunit alpha